MISASVNLHNKKQSTVPNNNLFCLISSFALGTLSIIHLIFVAEK